MSVWKRSFAIKPINKENRVNGNDVAGDSLNIANSSLSKEGLIVCQDETRDMFKDAHDLLLNAIILIGKHYNFDDLNINTQKA